jgi:hypothetical protein
VSKKKNLKTYIDVLKKCADGESPITSELESSEFVFFRDILVEFETKEWIKAEHANSDYWHHKSKVKITCEGLIKLAELKKAQLENSLFYLPFLSIQNMLFITFGAILTVAGRLVFKIMN